VAQLILAQTTRPVIYGLLAGIGLATSLATALLAMPAGAMIAEVVRVTDPIAYAVSLLVILAACLIAAWIPAARAARLDPMRTLRQD
jgi:putative ABC transport system permease protein